MLKISTGAPMAPVAPEVEEESPALLAPPQEIELPVEPDPIPQSATPLPQAAVLYMGSESGPFVCANCCYYTEPASCRVVAGSIDPYGCCNLYCPPNHEEGGMEERPIESPMPEMPEIEPPVEPEMGSEAVEEVM